MARKPSRAIFLRSRRRPEKRSPATARTGGCPRGVPNSVMVVVRLVAPGRSPSVSSSEPGWGPVVRFVAIVAAIVSLSLGAASPSLAAKRIALVIGNNAYGEVSKLEKAVGDA